MIQRNIRDDANPRLNHVGRIQTPAHANFKHRHVHLRPGEVLERNRCQHLKETGMPGQFPFLDQTLCCPLYKIVKRAEIVISDFLATYANALINTHQVRRSIQTRS